MSWDIFPKSKIQYFLEKLKDKFVQKETGKGLSTNDYTTTDKNKVSKIDTTTTSISGNPISISGLKANQLASNPIITLEPIQAGSGTPSPSNIRAISGYDKIEVLSCGKNIFDKSQVVQGGLDNNTGAETSGSSTYRSGWMCVKPNTTYIISGISTLRPFYYGKGKVFIERSSTTTGSVFTTPNGCNFVRFQIATSVWETVTNAQVEEGSSATTYVPHHKATSISESLGQTVYGGSLDVRTGKVRVTRTIADLGNLSWTYDSSGHRFFSNSLGSLVGGSTDGSIYTNVVFSCYKKSIDASNNSAFIFANNKYLYVYDNRYTDAASFKTAIAGQTVCYELATPIEIQLTPQEIILLSIYAYVSTNGTNIALDYHNGELASLSDVAQVGETVNELSQAFQDGCDEIMGAVAAKGVTPASNSPDDISKAIRSLVTYEQPIEFDYRCGYIMNGVWYYENPTDTLSDIYEVKNGHTYYMFFGNVTGTRFRAITTTTDIRTVTSGTITGDQTVKNSSNPGALSYVTFTSTVDGYFIVCKDNVGKTGITTYMQDRTTM